MNYIKVNKLIKKPLYVQISDAIEEAFLEGILVHGDSLPTEKQLCETFDISPKVVSMMYRYLIKKGFVVRVIGKGTFIHSRHTTRVELKAFLKLDDKEMYKKEIVYVAKVKKPSSVMLTDSDVYVIYEVVYKKSDIVMLKKVYIESEFESHIYSLKTTKDIINIIKPFEKIESKLVAINLLEVESLYLKVNKHDPGFLSTTYYKNNNLVRIQEERYFPGAFTVWEETLDDVSLL
jgi:DNA-binding GntR family transcriptional regulator